MKALGSLLTQKKNVLAQKKARVRLLPMNISNKYSWITYSMSFFLSDVLEGTLNELNMMFSFMLHGRGPTLSHSSCFWRKKMAGNFWKIWGFWKLRHLSASPTPLPRNFYVSRVHVFPSLSLSGSLFLSLSPLLLSSSNTSLFEGVRLSKSHGETLEIEEPDGG